MAETLTGTYWNSKGKYQEQIDKFTNLVPSCGYTENKYMNLFIAISNIYYDVNNNGGGNLYDVYHKRVEQYILPFENELKSLRLNVKYDTLVKNFKNEEKLEAFMDEIILYLEDKDLTHKQYTLYFNNNTDELSKTPVDGFHKITFGEEQEYIDWMNHRMHIWHYKMIG